MLQLINDSILMWDVLDYVKAAFIIALAILFGYRLVSAVVVGVLGGFAR